MSVYIRGMEMPESCEDCIFFTSKPVSRCTLIGNIISSFDDERLSDCPMVEVPKKGKWLDLGKHMTIRWICSECGRRDMHIYDYCPDCGTDMREE